MWRRQRLWEVIATALTTNGMAAVNQKENGTSTSGCHAAHAPYSETSEDTRTERTPRNEQQVEIEQRGGPARLQTGEYTVVGTQAEG